MSLIPYSRPLKALIKFTPMERRLATISGKTWGSESAQQTPWKSFKRRAPFVPNHMSMRPSFLGKVHGVYPHMISRRFFSVDPEVFHQTVEAIKNSSLSDVVQGSVESLKNVDYAEVYESVRRHLETAACIAVIVAAYVTWRKQDVKINQPHFSLIPVIVFTHSDLLRLECAMKPLKDGSSIHADIDNSSSELWISAYYFDRWSRSSNWMFGKKQLPRADYSSAITTRQFHKPSSTLILDISNFKKLPLIEHETPVNSVNACDSDSLANINQPPCDRATLHTLLHHPAAGQILTLKKRVSMAFNVANAISYLHCDSPPSVHPAISSHNMVFDQNCNINVWISTPATDTSSKTTNGYSQWMAPEVIGGETADIKSHAYSFGVILWELLTLEQPWTGFTPSQVVVAVAIEHKQLTIPDNTSTVLCSLMKSCWERDATRRPTFETIVATLKQHMESLEDIG